MRLSEMAGKELVDVSTGTRIGLLGGADLIIDEETGRIDSILMSSSGFSFGKKRADAVISWGAIMKIGPDMIVLDSDAEGMHNRPQTATGTRD
jgi:YlmC/YmxH family sporulation protein